MATAQVTARLSADASDFKSVLSSAESHAGKIAGGITKKFELKDLGRTMATALGLNIETMGRAFARFATGMTEELEAAYGRVVAASERATAAVIANIRSQGSEETKYQAMLQERARLQATLDKKQANAADIEPPSWWARIKASPFSGTFYDHGMARAEEYAANNKAALDANLEKVTKLDEQIKAIEEKRSKAEVGGVDAHQKWIAGLKEGKVVTEQLATAEDKRLETAEQITEEVGKQVEELEEVKKQTIEITRIGREDSELSDRELQRKVKNLRAGIDATSRSTIGDPTIGKFLNQPAELELARLKGEIDLRKQVRFAASRFGEDRAFQMFNLSESRFGEIIRGQEAAAETNKLLRGLTDRFDRGIRVRSVTTPGSQTVEE